VSDIDEKKITIELTGEETVALMAAVLGRIMTPYPLANNEINALGRISAKVQSAIIALQIGDMPDSKGGEHA